MLSNTGFSPDGKWHGLGKTLRTEGEGEAALENMTKELFATTLKQSAPGIDDTAVDEYWKAFADEQRRQGHSTSTAPATSRRSSATSPSCASSTSQP